jgi:glyoxylase-like metal-dependent hydrolase (beta-lactamase superfamily II)
VCTEAVTSAGAVAATDADLVSATRAAVDSRPVQVRAGLWSLPVDIPIAALKVVNVYAFEHPDRSLTLLDTGWDTERSWRSLLERLRAIGRRPDDVAQVVVSHAHPDHLGLAHRLRAISGAEVLLEQHEATRLVAKPPLPTRFRDAVRETFPRWGVPEKMVTDVTASAAPSSESSWTVPVTPVADGDLLPVPGWSLRALWAPGHTPGHLCLYEQAAGLLFTGDHVLPRITPGVGTHPADDEDPLGDFLSSLDRVSRLDVAEVLPGHEYRFDDLPGRVAALRDHHRARLAEVLAAVAAVPGCTAWSVTTRLTWSRPLHRFGGPMIRGAIAETAAHLAHLRRAGRLRVETSTTGRATLQVWFPC